LLPNKISVTFYLFENSPWSFLKATEGILGETHEHGDVFFIMQVKEHVYVFFYLCP